MLWALLQMAFPLSRLAEQLRLRYVTPPFVTCPPMVKLLRDNDDSDAILRLLKAEEAKLTALRKERAALTAPKAAHPAPRPPDAAKVRKMFESLAELLQSDRDAARAALAECFEPFRLRPVVGADGSRSYHLEMPLKNSLLERPLQGAGFEPATFGL